jgi:hypothetical protein
MEMNGGPTYSAPAFAAAKIPRGFFFPPRRVFLSWPVISFRGWPSPAPSAVALVIYNHVVAGTNMVILRHILTAVSSGKRGVSEAPQDRSAAARPRPPDSDAQPLASSPDRAPMVVPFAF